MRITLAKYNEKPLTVKAITIARGITSNNVLSFSMNIFSIAGSSNHAMAEVAAATHKEKNTDKKILGRYCFV